MPFRRRPPKGSTPTRQNTGITAETKGAPVQPPNLSELGSSTAQKLYDPLPELSSPAVATRTYRKMVRTDASVRVSLRAGKAPVLGADYYLDPYDANPENDVIKSFVEYNLFNGMTTPFKQVLEQILKMYEDGWALLEPVWELREWGPDLPNAKRRQYTMLRKLAVRPVNSISKIEYDDNGGPLMFTQRAIRANGKPEDVKIPIEKSLVFTFDKEGGDVTGNSILRSAYQHWYYKDYLYKIDAIAKERHGIGIPDVELQPGYSENDKKFARELAENLRTNEKAFVLRNTMLKVGFVELSGNPVDAMASAQHHDAMIMKNIMVQFLNMGIEAGTGGGRATGATSMDMFLKAMRYVAETLICEAFNMYLIPNMVAYNFNTNQFPRLMVRNIGETKDLQMWSSAMSNLIKNEAIQVDDETEQWIRAQMDMPKRTSDFVAPQPKNTNNGIGDGKGPIETGNIGKSESSGAT